jgi:hypothetical protein
VRFAAGFAVMRGLLLDLLATGDRAAADAALERFVAGYEALAGSNLARRPSTEKPSRA